MAFRLIICVILWLLPLVLVHSQDRLLMVRAEGQAPDKFLSELSLQSGINIIYNDNLIERLPAITLELKGVSLDAILTEVFRHSDIGFRYIGNQIVLFQEVLPLDRYTISGLITDSLSGEPLISAFVYDEISKKSTQTNEYGFYSLNLPTGNVSLIIGYLGFDSEKRNFLLGQNRKMHIELKPKAVLPEVIVIADRRFDPANDPLPHAERFTPLELQKRTQIGGAYDLYRSADFITGVHTGTDGVGGIHVRGGANDQNLILMDGVPVYHPNHLLGIISVFNHHVLQQASIYKANFPTKFSGRLSSVMDVRTREGNINQWGYAGNIGASEMGLMIEGPIVKEKVAILLSGRFFLPGLVMPDLTRRLKLTNGVEGFADIDYSDFNGKINWRLGQRDRMYLSMYRGSDRFSDFTITRRNEVDPKTGIRIVSKETYDKNLNWSNTTGVFRWNHLLNDKIFANVIVSSSSFELQSVDRSDFNFVFPQSNLNPISGFDTKEFKSRITDVTAKIELDIRLSPDHHMTSGLYGIDYEFLPKSITINEESKVGDFVLDEGLLDDIHFSEFKVRALEAGIYAEDKWDISDQWRLTSGMHISRFFVQKTYYLDPQLRMSLDFHPKENLAFNIGYSRMAQYLHNITSSSIGLPTDLWVPTTRKVSPALSDQYALAAWWRPFRDISVDVSAYIKDMRNLISYQEGASFLLKEGLLQGSIVDAGNWESKITTGKGDAEGVELELNYDRPRASFTLNGTWSRSFRYYEDINDNKPFPDRYDRRWSSSFTGEMKVGERVSLGMSFLYGSGIAITLAESKFFSPGSFFPQVGINYSPRNAFRLPPYHRLDVTFNYRFKKGKRFDHALTLHLYNVYNRTNPFYITLVQDPLNQKFEFKQFSLFRFFPSLSWKFSFQ